MLLQFIQTFISELIVDQLAPRKVPSVTTQILLELDYKDGKKANQSQRIPWINISTLFPRADEES